MPRHNAGNMQNGMRADRPREICDASESVRLNFVGKVNRRMPGYLLRNDRDASVPFAIRFRDHWPRQWQCTEGEGGHLRAINACRMERYPEAESLLDPSTGTESRGILLLCSGGAVRAIS